VNIHVSKDGAVSFTQMNPTAARLLLDLATDLAAGRLALRYPEDGHIVEPSVKARTALATIASRYERHDTPPVGGPEPWDAMWKPVPTGG
jgi:hypothetical protein